MSTRDIGNGKWVKVETENEHSMCRKHGRVDGTPFGSARCQSGEWAGPGWYYILSYSQRCPRGCCYDDCIEVLSADEAVEAFREEIGDLAHELEQALAYRSEK